MWHCPLLHAHLITPNLPSNIARTKAPIFMLLVVLYVRCWTISFALQRMILCAIGIGAISCDLTQALFISLGYPKLLLVRSIKFNTLCCFPNMEYCYRFCFHRLMALANTKAESVLIACFRLLCMLSSSVGSHLSQLHIDTTVPRIRR